MFNHKEKLTKLIKECSESNATYEDVVRRVALECAKLCERHAEEMNYHGFDAKASTATTCAGIIKEAYDLKNKIKSE